MGNPTDTEKEILENWRHERDELDSLIAALEKRIELRSSTGGTSGNRKLAPDEFFRLSTPEAIKKYLRIVGKPARATTDIIDGLKAGGMETNYTNVYTALGRLQKKDEVVKVGENWGLNEWYPPAPGREARSTNGRDEQTVLSALEDDASGASENAAVSNAVQAETANVSRSPNFTRKDAVAEFLRTHGPATRAEIMAGTNIPEGTISSCLRDQAKFVRSEDGKWSSVESAQVKSDQEMA